MRHSRRAVMAERYKLYAKKNIINSRYLVRNIQVGVLAVMLLAMVIGTIVLLCTGSGESAVTNSENTVKDALFGIHEEVETVTKEALTEQTTEKVVTTEGISSVVAEKVQEKLPDTTTEIANFETEVVEVPVEPEVQEEEKSEFENKCIANVEETLNIRKSPSADAEFVGSMNTGAIAIVSGVEGEWTKIKSGDVEGYVLTEYILTGASAEEFAKDYVTLRGTVLEDGVNVRAEKSTDADILMVMDKDASVTVIEQSEEETAEEMDITNTAMTEVGVAENNAIGEDVVGNKTLIDTAAETNAVESNMTEDNVAKSDVIESGATETVLAENGLVSDTTESNVVAENTDNSTEETTVTIEAEINTTSKPVDSEETEIQWLSVMLEDGRVGYVSAEFVEIERLYEIAVSAEELERRAIEEAERQAAAEAEAARLAAEAEAARQAAVQQQNTSSYNSSVSTESNYQGATTQPVTATASGESIGTFTITAYCGCDKCSGGHGKTASGTTPTEGRTVAADTSILPFGTQVVIDGIVYTVEDRGSGVSGNHIDIFFATHEKAVAFGKKTITVFKY